MMRNAHAWKRRPRRLTGLLLVGALHVAVVCGVLWSPRPPMVSREPPRFVVHLVAPPEPPGAVPSARMPVRGQPRAPAAMPAPQARANTAAVTFVQGPPSPPGDVAHSPVDAERSTPEVVEPLPVGPVVLASELSVVCPQRAAPVYPALSRRLAEAGAVVLWVELDEAGQVAMARVHSSSGFDRLDDAALAAVRRWTCAPPLRNGQPARATALQPFQFVLRGA